MNTKGFTLLELAIVLVIVSVLATISIGVFVSYGNATKDSAVKFSLTEVHRIAQLGYHDGVEVASWDSLTDYGFRLGENVIINLENGFEETFLTSGYYAGREDVIYQIDECGNVTRR